MWLAGCVVVLLVGCGRVGFDNSTAAVPGDGAVDAPPDSAPLGADEVLVPAGPFLRGCTPAVGACEADGRGQPQRSITLSQFAIERTEVTQASYQSCIAAGTCTPPSAGFDPVNQATHPVAYVSWAQATEYC